MATAITGRQTWTESREGDWAVSGAVLGLTAALVQILARRWRGEGGKRGKRVDVGEYGETRIDFKKRMQEINKLNINNVDNMNSDGNINNTMFATIEEEYHHNSTLGISLSFQHKQENMILTILIKTFAMLKVTTIWKKNKAKLCEGEGNILI